MEMSGVGNLASYAARMANSHSPFGVPRTGARQRAGREAPRSRRHPYETEPADQPLCDTPSREQRALPHTGASGHTGTLGAIVPDESPPKDGEADRPKRAPRQRSEGVTQPLRRAQAKARKRRQWWMATLVTTVGIAVMAACGVGTWMILTETEPDLVPGAQEQVPASDDEAEDEPAEVEEPVSDREDNPDPLTVDELFPTDEITHDDADTEYQVLVSEEIDDCPEATFDGVADALDDLDCSQVVRATVVDESETYVATVGVMNLVDDSEATELREAVEDNDIDGGFTALRDDDIGTDLGRTLTVLGHNIYGHYFLYAVVGQVDGEEPDSEDDQLRAVVDDVVDGWLVDQLSERSRQE